MVAAIDLTGQRFGKLVALRRVENYAGGQARWLLQCDCGGTTYAHTGELRAGKRKACRCGLSHPTHGLHKTRLHRVWSAMKVRCTSEKHPRYARYGGRGIAVCAEWQKFEPFASWALANGYRDDLQIDRIDNSQGYYPANCRFVTAAENMANRG